MLIFNAGFVHTGYPVCNTIGRMSHTVIDVIGMSLTFTRFLICMLTPQVVYTLYLIKIVIR